MAAAGPNDSIITFGLELTEETEKSAGEIASELGKEGPAMAANMEPQQAAPEQQQQAGPEQDQALQEARALAQQAHEHEEAEKANQLEYLHEN
jgi:hypothetical protein